MKFDEDFLHYVWKFQLFNNRQLITKEGDLVVVLDPGQHNFDAGPDFLNARIKLGGTLWAGSVEIHKKATEYFQHKHHEDNAYANVVLHVVYDADCLMENMPTLELKSRIPGRLVSKYEELQLDNTKIPCKQFISTVDTTYLKMWIERMAVERMEAKCADYQSLLLESQNNWYFLLITLIGKALGGHINAQPFEMLVRKLGQGKLLHVYANDIIQLEALVFGVAGFLGGNNSMDNYQDKLSDCFNHLKRKHNLKPMDKSLWKFLRTRPANFPTSRLAQFCAIIHCGNLNVSSILNGNKTHITKAFEQIWLNPYWRHHYNFGLEKKRIASKGISKNTIHLIAINAIVPFLFIYGQSTSQDEYSESAMALLDAIPVEKNHIVSLYRNMGVEVTTAIGSQGLLGMYKTYCSRKKCVNCAIGNRILSST